MQSKTERKVRQYHRMRRQRVRAYAALTVLALVVSMGTGLALVKPAAAMENTTYCGLETHAHNEACYEPALICADEDREGHTHADGCWEYPCGLEETEGHEHVPECFDQQQNMICGQEVCAAHSHALCGEKILICGKEEEPACDTDHEHREALGCYEDKLICGKEAHAHMDTCYMAPVVYCGFEEHFHSEFCIDENGLLVCGMENHVHVDECYAEPIAVFCGYEEHIHEAACLNEFGNLICGLEEHVHEDACYVEPIEVFCGYEAHFHDAYCMDEFGNAICGLEEHAHADECFFEIVEGELVPEEVTEFDQELFITPFNFTSAAKMMLSAATAPYDRTQSEYLETNKVVLLPDANDLTSYKLRLESYLTGEPEVTSEIPCDIVVALDQSGSMNYCFYCGDPGCDGQEILYVDEDQSNFDKALAAEGLYYKRSDSIGARDAVYYCEICTQMNNEEYGNSLTFWYTEPHITDHTKGTGYFAKQSKEQPTAAVDNLGGTGNKAAGFTLWQPHVHGKNVDLTKNTVYYGMSGIDAQLAAEGYYYRHPNHTGPRYRLYYCEQCTQENMNGYAYWYDLPHDYGRNGAYRYDHSRGKPYVAKLSEDDITGTVYDNSGTRNGVVAPKVIIMRLAAETCLDTKKDRRDALQESLNEFLNIIDQQVAEDQLDHRVAIVGFGSYDEATTEVNASNALLTYPKNGTSTSEAETIGYATLKAEGGEAYYEKALQHVNTAAGWNILKDSIGNILEEGHTHTHKGVEMAVDIFKNNPLADGEKRNRIVVVFSDGIPFKSNTSENEDGIFDEEGIDGNYEDSYLALEHAKTLKDNGVTVYAIAIFSNADGSIRKNWDNKLNANKFMHLLSSNYLNATTVKAAYTEADLNEVVRNGGNSYYLSAGTQDGLTNAFKQIAESIQPGGAYIKGMDETSIVRDVLSSDFVLNGDVADIKAWTETFTSIDSDNQYVFEKTATDVDYTTSNITVDGQVISVTGFNFSENFVTVDDNLGQPIPRGKRIVVEIPIKRSDTNPGGNKQATNIQDHTQTYNSAVYRVTDTGTLIDVEEFDLPYVDTPTSITIIKQVEGVDIPTQKFSFHVNYSKHTGYQSSEGSSPDSNHLAAISASTDNTKDLGHHESWSIDQLIVGSTITITEKQLAGYSLGVQVNGKSISTEFKNDGAGNVGVEIPVQPNMVITFTNTTGPALPNTGGMGTAIFYVVGAALMLGAAVFLVARKKMGTEK